MSEISFKIAEKKDCAHWSTLESQLSAEQPLTEMLNLPKRYSTSKDKGSQGKMVRGKCNHDTVKSHAHWLVTHRMCTKCTREASSTGRKCWASQQPSPACRLGKPRGVCKESDFDGQRDLTAGFHRPGGKETHSWGHTRDLVCNRTQRKEAMPSVTGPDLPAGTGGFLQSCWGSCRSVGTEACCRSWEALTERGLLEATINLSKQPTGSSAAPPGQTANSEGTRPHQSEDNWDCAYTQI